MKLFRSSTVSLAVAFSAFLASQTLLPNNPASHPSWFMNFDSALFYYVYYSLGSVLYPLTNRQADTTFQRASLIALAAVSFMVTVITFFQPAYWLFGKITTQFPALGTFKLSAAFFDFFLALAGIYCNIIVARLFAHVLFLGELGRETLTFCGTEDVLKNILSQLLVMVNLKLRLINPFVTIAFSLACLVISKYTLVGFLNTYFPWAVGKINPAPSS